MRKQLLGLLIVPAIVAGVFVACDDDSNDTGSTDAGADHNTAKPDGSTGTPDSGGPTDAGTDGAKQVQVKVLADFPAVDPRLDAGYTFMPEGIATIPNAADFSTPLVSFTPAGATVAVFPDGGFDYVEQFTRDDATKWTRVNARQLTVARDTNGDLYVTVAIVPKPPIVDGGPPQTNLPPGAGLFKLPAGFDGGTDPQKIISFGPGSWPSGLVIRNGFAYVADAAGKVYRVNLANPVLETWASDPDLRGGKNACPSGSTTALRPFGAYGLAQDANNLYVTNSDHGAVIKYPFDADGGSPTVIFEGRLNDAGPCDLQGIRGIAVDKDGTILVAGWGEISQNKLFRMNADGSNVKVVIQNKPPLDQPSGLWIDQNAATGERRLLITNFPIAAAAQNAGNPLPQLLEVKNLLAE